MEIVNVSEVKSLVLKAQTALAVALHALNTKILIGEINHPETPVEKKVRKKRTRKVKVVEPGMVIANILDSSLPDAKKIKSGRRTKKEMELAPPRSQPQMDLEKEYQAERHEPLNLPEDKDPFFAKVKKVRKKREKKVPMVE